MPLIENFIIVDGDGIILFVNPVAEELLGRQPDDLIGMALGLPLVSDKRVELTVLHSTGKVVMVDIEVVSLAWNDRPAFRLDIIEIKDSL